MDEVDLTPEELAYLQHVIGDIIESITIRDPQGEVIGFDLPMDEQIILASLKAKLA